PLTNGDAGFGTQLLGLVTIFVWTFVVSLLAWGVLRAAMGIRVSEEEEMQGVDMAECGMEAYPEFMHGGMK
ncbi:MAG: ammonium transporter, partial [Pseudomonadota bacterium]